MDSSAFQAALAYARSSLPVFPCKPDKTPHVRGGFKAATTNEDVIGSWWAQWPEAMIGMPTGPASGVWALDIDMPKGVTDGSGYDSLQELIASHGDLPSTWTQKTPSGGTHYIFRYPTDGMIIRNSAGKVGPKIDVRGDGGYIIVAPSVNHDGHSYQTINGSPAVPAPAWLLALATASSDNSSTLETAQSDTVITDASSGLHPYVAAALKNVSAAIASAEPDTRNDTLFKNIAALAGFIPAGYLSEETLRAEAEAAFLKCHPDDYNPKEFEDSFNSAVKAGKSTPREIPYMLPLGFRIVKEGPQAGLHFTDPTKDADAPSAKICIGPPLYVRGRVRDDDSSNWGLLLEWNDHDGKPHRWNLPYELLSAADSSGWRSHLAKNGWLVQGGRKGHELLTRYLTESKPARRLTCVPRTGWHHGAFVLPDKVLANSEAQAASIILQNPPTRNQYRHGGTLEEWRNTIGLWSKGNSRLLFALCAALSGPLLGLLNQESGGFNWTGASSTGKTTTLFAAASVWGKGTLSDGYILPWRSTDNGLEAQAVLHSDTVLCLDELSQASARTITEAAYMLGNSQGKARATRTGGNRDPKTWRLTYLSTGEQGLAEKIAEVGGTVKAGQAVRLLDIPADAGAGLGLFENLHGHASAQAFADAIKQAAATHYGHAGMVFINDLIKHAAIVPGVGKAILPSLAEKLSGNLVDGQVKRAAMRFALCEVAGRMAVRAGILPVDNQAVSGAVESCFKAWLDNRGSTGALEDMQVVERARHFIEKHGASRFQSLNPPQSPFPGGETLCLNRAGFKAADSAGRVIYYVLDDGFKEICQGIPTIRAARALLAAGILIPGGPDRLKNKLPKDVPGLGRASAYALFVHTP